MLSTLNFCFESFCVMRHNTDHKLESGFDVLAGAPECCLLPEIAIRTFRVLRSIGEDGAMQ